MQDPVETAPTASPFEPEPADLGGCGKPAVIGCLVVLVLLAVGFAIFVAKARDMLDWALLQYQEAVLTNLSEEVTDEEARRLEDAFESARDAIRDNRMEPSALQRLQRFMSSPPRPDRPVDSEAVRELTGVLEALAGTSMRPPGEQPAAAPPTGTTASAHHAAI